MNDSKAKNALLWYSTKRTNYLNVSDKPTVQTNENKEISTADQYMLMDKLNKIQIDITMLTQVVSKLVSCYIAMKEDIDKKLSLHPKSDKSEELPIDIL